MSDRTHDVIRQCGGIVHSDGNIFFTNRYQFEHAASVLLGVATVKVDACEIGGSAVLPADWEGPTPMKIGPRARQ